MLYVIYISINLKKYLASSKAKVGKKLKIWQYFLSKIS